MSILRQRCWCPLGVQLADRLMQILMADRAVPFERRHGLVSGDGHTAEIVNTGPPHVADERMAKIMKHHIGEPRLPTGRLECPPHGTTALRLPA